MKGIRREIGWVGVGLAVAVSLFLETQQFRSALRQMEQTGFKMLAHSVSLLLRKAYVAGDDLAIRDISGALLKTPGVRRVSIVEDRIVLEGSHSLKKELFGRYFLANLVLFGSIGAGQLGILGLFARRQRETRKLIQELRVLLEEESQKRSFAQTKLDQIQAQQDGLLRMMATYIERPLILLDAQQRVAAVSPAALAWLQAATADALSGKSWHELLFLEEYGLRIENAMNGAKDPRVQVHATPDGGSWVAISVE